MKPAPVSIATSFDYSVPLNVQVPLIADAGFTHFSLGANEAHSDYLTPSGRARIRALVTQLNGARRKLNAGTLCARRHEPRHRV